MNCQIQDAGKKPSFGSKFQPVSVVFNFVLALGLTCWLASGVQAQSNVGIGDNFSGTAAISPTFNNNQIQTENQSSNVNNIQVASINRPMVQAGAGAGAGAALIGSPSAFANTHLFNGPWNFVPPNLMFHCSKLSTMVHLSALVA